MKASGGSTPSWTTPLKLPWRVPSPPPRHHSPGLGDGGHHRPAEALLGCPFVEDRVDEPIGESLPLGVATDDDPVTKSVAVARRLVPAALGNRVGPPPHTAHQWRRRAVDRDPEIGHLYQPDIASGVCPAPRPRRHDRRRQHPPHPSHRRKGGDATDQLNCGQNSWPPPGSSVGHGWAVLLSATGQIPLAVDSPCPMGKCRVSPRRRTLENRPISATKNAHKVSISATKNAHNSKSARNQRDEERSQ